MQDSNEVMLDYADDNDLTDSQGSVSDVGSDDDYDIDVGDKQISLGGQNFDLGAFISGS
jgi:hypothetical protein